MVLLGSAGALALTLASASILPRDLLPDVDQGAFSISLELPEGTALAATDESLDVVLGLSILHLLPNREGAMARAWRLLKPGGEMYFSDVYSDRRVPDDLKQDPVLFGECLAGAFYWQDFLSAARKAGFRDPRLVSDIYIHIGLIAHGNGNQPGLPSFRGTGGDLRFDIGNNFVGQ